MTHKPVVTGGETQSGRRKQPPNPKSLGTFSHPILPINLPTLHQGLVSEMAISETIKTGLSSRGYQKVMLSSIAFHTPISENTFSQPTLIETTYRLWGQSGHLEGLDIDPMLEFWVIARVAGIKTRTEKHVPVEKELVRP